MSQIDDLPPLREIIAKYELRAVKSLGQNFLLDLNLTSRIARAAGPLDGVTVIEVGPGPGGLTRALLAAGPKEVVAIERDRRCLPALQEVADRYPGRLKIIEGDVLAVDMSKLAGERTRIVANLPYNIATPLLVGWLQSEPWPPWFESLTLMFQREVAERIVAAPATEMYGRLAVLTGLRADARILFDVDPRAFTPPPKVVSSVVGIVPHAQTGNFGMSALERVTAAAFGQRRKMLRQSLKSLSVETAELLATAGIDGTRRAEEIDLEGFARLARTFEAMVA